MAKTKTHLPHPWYEKKSRTPAGAKIFRVPPPFRGRTASLGPLASVRAALRPSQHGRGLSPLPIPPRPPPPKNRLSEKERAKKSEQGQIQKIPL